MSVFSYWSEIEPLIKPEHKNQAIGLLEDTLKQAVTIEVAKQRASLEQHTQETIKARELYEAAVANAETKAEQTFGAANKRLREENEQLRKEVDEKHKLLNRLTDILADAGYMYPTDE